MKQYNVLAVNHEYDFICSRPFSLENDETFDMFKERVKVAMETEMKCELDEIFVYPCEDFIFHWSKNTWLR